jgi:triacylglycerol lipase
LLIGSRDRSGRLKVGITDRRGDIPRTSQGLARIGGLSLALGLGAAIIHQGRRLLASADRSSSVAASSKEADADGIIDRTLHSAFTGQPSRNTKVVASVLRAVGAVTDSLGIDFGTQIAPLIALDEPPSFTMSGLDVHRDAFAGQPVYMIRSGNPSGKYVVALHGGAYVVQPTINHWSAYAELARRTQATVLVPMYPLASTPRGRAKTVIPDMADLISAEITRHGAGNVSVYGDSAGGGMALSVAQLLVKRGDATPGGMVLISPWLDVTLTNPAIALIDDPVLRTVSLRTAGEEWAGDLPLIDPLVSPIYGALEGLPTTAVYCGNLDLLAPDVLRLQARALATPAGEFTFILRNGAIHCWAMGGFAKSPESAAVQRDIYKQLGLNAND